MAAASKDSSKGGAVETGCSGLHHIICCFIIEYYPHPLHHPPTAPPFDEYPASARRAQRSPRPARGRRRLNGYLWLSIVLMINNDNNNNNNNNNDSNYNIILNIIITSINATIIIFSLTGTCLVFFSPAVFGNSLNCAVLKNTEN